MASRSSERRDEDVAGGWRWRWFLRPSRAEAFLSRDNPSASVVTVASVLILTLVIVMLAEALSSTEAALVKPVSSWLVSLLYGAAALWAIEPWRRLRSSWGARILVVLAVPVLGVSLLWGSAIYAAIWVALIGLLGNHLTLDELGVVVGLEGVTMLDLVFSAIYWLVVALWIGRAFRRIASARGS